MPRLAIAQLGDFSERLEEATIEAVNDRDVVLVAGVPAWTVALFDKLIEKSEEKDILSIWPKLRYYIHGGTSILPYKGLFDQYLANGKVQYWEVYNASEGFFSLRASSKDDDMLLLVNNGIYYEFTSRSDWEQEVDHTITLGDVAVDIEYVLIITTYSGLWRYVIGDVVRFTSLKPFKIKLVGRTQQFLNVFGEEIVVEQADAAIEYACASTGATILEYTVAPGVIDDINCCRHEWYIEFQAFPEDIFVFAQYLDSYLKSANSDYEEMRYMDCSLRPPIIICLPRNCFYNWLKKKLRYGDQNKIIRLSNDRRFVSELLSE